MNRLCEAVEFAGCQLSFLLEGEGPPVLFIQGVGLHGRGWLPQVQDLSADFRCLVFDNRGLGRSQPQGCPLTIHQMAQDALFLMSHLGWESAHVVGHSMGGPIAIEMALIGRARVRSLSLLCTVARGRDATRLSGRMLKLGILSRIGTRRSRRRAFLRIVLPDPALRELDPEVTAAELEPLFGHDLADQPPVVMKQLAALRAYDASGKLRNLAGIPTLVISAAHDPIAPPEYGRVLADGIPGARYEEFLDASHGVTLQHAGRINTLLRSHLNASEVARASI